MKKSAVLVSSVIILLCLSIIAGMSWALFTDSLTSRNHLRAGFLDVTLTRTHLVYSALNASGVLVEVERGDVLDLTDATNENVFGINSNDVFVVPGCFFDAELEFRKNSNVAVNYTIDIKLFTDVTDADPSNDEPNDLAKQLKVTITHPDGSETVKMLDELAAGLSIDAGFMTPTETVQKFSVRVEFVGDEFNNDAQSEMVIFDLIVSATQATATTNP